MDAVCVEILRNSLKPFLDEVYPDSHRFMQDNDPNHTQISSAIFQRQWHQLVEDSCWVSWLQPYREHGTRWKNIWDVKLSQE